MLSRRVRIWKHKTTTTSNTVGSGIKTVTKQCSSRRVFASSVKKRRTYSKYLWRSDARFSKSQVAHRPQTRPHDLCRCQRATIGRGPIDRHHGHARPGRRGGSRAQLLDGWPRVSLEIKSRNCVCGSVSKLGESEATKALYLDYITRLESELASLRLNTQQGEAETTKPGH